MNWKFWKKEKLTSKHSIEKLIDKPIKPYGESGSEYVDLTKCTLIIEVIKEKELRGVDKLTQRLYQDSNGRYLSLTHFIYNENQKEFSKLRYITEDDVKVVLLANNLQMYKQWFNTTDIIY